MHYYMLLTLFFALPFNPNNVLAFPQYASLAGLSDRQLAEILPTLQARDVTPPPGPLPANDSSTKLVYDAEHPYIPPGPDDIRGPCPAMNTLANHGYIPRNGIARPSQIVAALQEVFNMAGDLARIQVYATHVLDGNLVTDLISIGKKTSLTGTDPPHAVVGGLNDHSQVEGDASVSRADLYFGDNHSFNETVFQQFIRASKKSSDGRYDRNVAVDLRYQLFKDGIATNPTFDYSPARYVAAFNEAAFVYLLFVDGRSKYPGRLDMDAARSFFELGKLPDDFHRANQPLTGVVGGKETTLLQNAAPADLTVGKNNGTINSFIAQPGPQPQAADICTGYGFFITLVKQLYPMSITGDLRNSLKQNLHYFYEGCAPHNCTEQFPYGELS